MRALVGWLVGCLVLLGTAAPCWAQEAKQANELARSALTAYEEGRWADAYADFEEADGLVHSPVFVLYQARCRRAQGRLLEAEELYRSVSREDIAADAPAPFKKARDEARSELAALASEVPRLTVKTTDLEGAAVRVGDVAYTGEPLRLDPGSYEVVAEREGETVASTRVDLAKGQVRTVELSPSSTPSNISTPSPSPDVPAPDASSDGVATTTIIGGVLVGLGGASLIAGGVTGGLALSQASDAKDACGPDGICPGDSSLRDDATTMAHVSTATLVVGGALAVTGVVLLVVGGDDAEVGFSPTSVTFRARF